MPAPAHRVLRLPQRHEEGQLNHVLLLSGRASRSQAVTLRATQQACPPPIAGVWEYVPVTRSAPSVADKELIAAPMDDAEFATALNGTQAARPERNFVV